MSRLFCIIFCRKLRTNPLCFLSLPLSLISFLSVKKWLLRKKHQIELARKRGWKGYWVCLKGTTLLFYPCDSREGRTVEAAPKHLIIVDGAIMQPIPEHPKRDYIFCLSTAFGDAYLFQAPCQVSILLFFLCLLVCLLLSCADMENQLKMLFFAFININKSIPLERSSFFFLYSLFPLHPSCLHNFLSSFALVGGKKR